MGKCEVCGKKTDNTGATNCYKCKKNMCFGCRHHLDRYTFQDKDVCRSACKECLMKKVRKLNMKETHKTRCELCYGKARTQCQRCNMWICEKCTGKKTEYQCYTFCNKCS